MKAKKSPPKATKESSVSGIVYFSGVCLSHVNDLQSAYYSKFHKPLSRTDAVNLLVGKIPMEAAKGYIGIILSEIEQ